MAEIAKALNKEFSHVKSNIFTCDILSQYNDIVQLAINLFDEKEVKISEEQSRIIIKTPRIVVVMMLSTNEYKVYIHTYDLPKFVKEMEGDVYYEIMKYNGQSVRLMDKDSIKGYLHLKSIEDQFLKRFAD